MYYNYSIIIIIEVNVEASTCIIIYSDASLIYCWGEVGDVTRVPI